MLEKTNKINKKLVIMLLAFTLVLSNAAVIGAKTIKGNAIRFTYVFKGEYALNTLATGSTEINSTKSTYVEVEVTGKGKRLAYSRDQDGYVSLTKMVGKYTDLRIRNSASKNGATGMAYTYY